MFSAGRIDGESSWEVITAIQDYRAGGNNALKVLFVQRIVNSLNAAVGVDIQTGFLCRLSFEFADALGGMSNLTL